MTSVVNSHVTQIRLMVYAALLVLTTLSSPLVQAAEPTEVLIKNAHLIDRRGVAEDVVVNILIKDNKLHIVTKSLKALGKGTAEMVAGS